MGSNTNHALDIGNPPGGIQLNTELDTPGTHPISCAEIMALTDLTKQSINESLVRLKWAKSKRDEVLNTISYFPTAESRLIKLQED